MWNTVKYPVNFPPTLPTETMLHKKYVRRIANTKCNFEAVVLNWIWFLSTVSIVY